MKLIAQYLIRLCFIRIGIVIFMFIPLIAAAEDEVIPDFYQDPGIYPNRDYLNQHFNEHIDPFTGALQLHYVDIHLPGNGGFDLNVTRSYNSASVDPANPSAYRSIAGVGWTIHFGRVLKSGNNSICFNNKPLVTGDNPVLELSDGSRQLFTFPGGTSSPLMLTTQFWKAECIVGSSGTGLAVYSPDGTRYDMTHIVNESISPHPVYVWYTTKITDRNGNSAEIHYAAPNSPEITHISTTDGRTVNFNYADRGLLSRRVTQISSGDQIYSYSYEPIPEVLNKYYLTSVTRPDGTKWQYLYNHRLDLNPGSYVIQRMINPEGGMIDYEYSFVYFDPAANPNYRSTVVSEKTISSGGIWSFSYVPGAPGNPDTTTVLSLSGTIVYRHIGPNYSSSGTVWMVGLLVSKTVGSLLTETYSWGKYKISNENYYRPGKFLTKVDSGETNAPVLLQKQIIQDGASYTTNYSNFDAYGNPRTIVEAGPGGGNRVTSLAYFYNPAKWIVKQVKDESFDGSAISRTFDDNGNLLLINQDGVITSHTYDGEGNRVSTTFPRSLTHHYSNYKRGIAQMESQPEGIQIRRQVSDAGNVISGTNGDGFTTMYQYDGLNRIAHIDYPAGNSTTIVWRGGSPASKTATRGSLTETTLFDGFGRPVSTTLGGIKHTRQYDALGRKIFESNPNSAAGTSYQYDALDRIVQITHADGTRKSISYGAGSKIEEDERGKRTSYTYRAYGDPGKMLLMSIAAPDSSANLTMTRNNKGLVTSIIPSASKDLARTYAYNDNYYLVSVTDPETGVTQYERDAAGNMIARTVGSSGATKYNYDGQNRVVSVTYPGTTPSITNTYSKRNKLLTSSTPGMSRSFSYDANDNVTSETVNIDGLTFTTHYNYNDNDQLTAITYPQSGRVVNYEPDVLGRPTKVADFINRVEYWPSGQIRQINYANGTVTDYQQNARLLPSTLSTKNSGGSQYINSSYSYDGAGNLVAISDSIDSSYNRSMGYDDINRLTSISGPWGAGTIAYNGVGNITKQTLGDMNLNYSYDSRNRLAGVTGSRVMSFSYDAYGNITNDSSKTYTYDDAPNLRCVNCDSPGTKIEYGYDNANQRILTTKGDAKTYEIYGSHGNLLVELNSGGSTGLTEYIYLGGRRIAQVQTGGAINPDSGTPTVLQLTASAYTVSIGESSTVTVTVTGNNPTGIVTLKDGINELGTSELASGQAAFTVSLGSAGLHTITAEYQGDALNKASTATIQIQVNTITTSLELTATPNPAMIGENVILIATISGRAPKGSVTFSDDIGLLGAANIIDNKATFTAFFPTAGTKNLIANYSGDENHAASTGKLTLTVRAYAEEQVLPAILQLLLAD